MSTTYLLYAEAKVDGKWRCIDGYLPFKDYHDTEEKMHLMTLYESGSRSYFGKTSDELKSIGTLVPFSELSEEIQNEHPDLRYRVSWDGTEGTEEECYTVISKTALDAKTPIAFQRHAVIHKDKITAFEAGEIEDLFEDEEPLKEKTPEELKCYQYYEWDDPFGWYNGFKIIKEALNHDLSKYCNLTFKEPVEVRIVLFVL